MLKIVVEIVDARLSLYLVGRLHLDRAFHYCWPESVLFVEPVNQKSCSAESLPLSALSSRLRPAQLSPLLCLD